MLANHLFELAKLGTQSLIAKASRTKSAKYLVPAYEQQLKDIAILQDFLPFGVEVKDLIDAFLRYSGKC